MLAQEFFHRKDFGLEMLLREKIALKISLSEKFEFGNFSRRKLFIRVSWSLKNLSLRILLFEMFSSGNFPFRKDFVAFV